MHGNRSSEITITLLSIDKRSYSVGGEVTFEVKIQNSGNEVIEIPWSDATVTPTAFDAMAVSFVPERAGHPKSRQPMPAFPVTCVLVPTLPIPGH